MKRLLPFIMLLILFCPLHPLEGSTQLVDAEKEPQGFRGIVWKTHIDELEEMILLQEYPDSSGRKDYIRSPDELLIGEIGIEPPRYIFYNDEFYEVVIDFQGDARELIRYFRDLYGGETLYRDEINEIAVGRSQAQGPGYMPGSVITIGEADHLKWDFPHVGIEIINNLGIPLPTATAPESRGEERFGLRRIHMFYKEYAAATDVDEGDLLFSINSDSPVGDSEMINAKITVAAAENSSGDLSIGEPAENTTAMEPEPDGERIAAIDLQKTDAAVQEAADDSLSGSNLNPPAAMPREETAVAATGTDESARPVTSDMEDTAPALPAAEIVFASFDILASQLQTGDVNPSAADASSASSQPDSKTAAAANPSQEEAMDVADSLLFGMRPDAPAATSGKETMVAPVAVDVQATRKAEAVSGDLLSFANMAHTAEAKTDLDASRAIGRVEEPLPASNDLVAQAEPSFPTSFDILVSQRQARDVPPPAADEIVPATAENVMDITPAAITEEEKTGIGSDLLLGMSPSTGSGKPVFIVNQKTQGPLPASYDNLVQAEATPPSSHDIAANQLPADHGTLTVAAESEFPASEPVAAVEPSAAKADTALRTETMQTVTVSADATVAEVQTKAPQEQKPAPTESSAMDAVTLTEADAYAAREWLIDRYIDLYWQN